MGQGGRHGVRAREVVLLGEFARAFGMKRSTAYIRARAGELPFTLVAGRYEMARRDFDRLLARHPTKAEANGRGRAR